MRTPSTEEVEAARAGIDKDSPAADFTLELALLVRMNPQLRGSVFRFVRAGRMMMGDLGEPEQDVRTAALESLIQGALMYGLNLGIRIGEARPKS